MRLGLTLIKYIQKACQKINLQKKSKNIFFTNICQGADIS